MGLDCIKGNQNIYFKSRKHASEYNDRLCSRDGAADLLGVSSSTLADYELGNTKVVPVDKVVLMADLYKCPELKNNYCKNECPIGQNEPIAVKVDSIERTALKIISVLDEKEIRDLSKSIITICADGKISHDERPVLLDVVRRLDILMESVSEMKLIAEKELES